MLEREFDRRKKEKELTSAIDPAHPENGSSELDDESQQFAMDHADGASAMDHSVPGTPADPSALLPWMDDVTETAGPLQIGGGGAGANETKAHTAAPKQVADSGGKSGGTTKSKESATPNIVLNVVVTFANGETAIWGGKSRWAGPGTPKPNYTATASGLGWNWAGGAEEARSVKIMSDLEGNGGKDVQTWAATESTKRKSLATKITISVQPLRNVTQDKDAKASKHAPGHVDEADAGDGTSNKYKEKKTGSSADKAGGSSATKPGENADAGKTGSGPTGNGGFGASKEELKGVEAFERSIGIDPVAADKGSDEHGTDSTSGGSKPGGKGEAGGSMDGRTGKDTEIGGTGPGGKGSHADGDGEGSEGGGKGGTKSGDKDGKETGSEGGMYGGEGKEGQDGVPSAMGLAGGLVGVPQALKGAVELALIVSEADVSGFGKRMFVDAAKHLTTKAAKEAGEMAADAMAPAIRSAIASEARVEAAKATKKAVQKIATDKKTAAAWKAASKAERDAFQRSVYYQSVNQFYDEAERAAKQARKSAEKAMKKNPADAVAKEEKRVAEAVEQATEVKPVASRLPQNHAYAGKNFPGDQLPKKYRDKGLKFSKEGYPDFEPHAKELKSGGKSVEIEYTGSRGKDFTAANKAAELDRTPKGWTWHHVEDGKRMMLIPDDLHDAVKHTGGVAHFKEATGIATYE